MAISRDRSRIDDIKFDMPTFDTDRYRPIELDTMRSGMKVDDNHMLDAFRYAVNPTYDLNMFKKMFDTPINHTITFDVLYKPKTHHHRRIKLWMGK